MSRSCPEGLGEEGSRPHPVLLGTVGSLLPGLGKGGGRTASRGLSL